MTAKDNPCLTCPDTCCALKGECGLRLSQDEFDFHFKEHMQDLQVRQEGKVVIVSTNQGLVCPHLGNKGCRIYAERPIDCRLYPYQMLPIYETRKKARFLLYMHTDCVENKSFSISEDEAKSLVRAFGKKVFGGKQIDIQVYRDEFFAKLTNKVSCLTVNFFQKLGVHP